MFSTVGCLRSRQGMINVAKAQKLRCRGWSYPGSFFHGKILENYGEIIENYGNIKYIYNVRPPSYKLVYNPHEYYTYKYDKP